MRTVVVCKDFTDRHAKGTGYATHHNSRGAFDSSLYFPQIFRIYSRPLADLLLGEFFLTANVLDPFAKFIGHLFPSTLFTVVIIYTRRYHIEPAIAGATHILFLLIITCLPPASFNASIELFRQVNKTTVIHASHNTAFFFCKMEPFFNTCPFK